MAANPKELLYWLQDLWAYRSVSRKRRALRQPGQGTSYVDLDPPVQEIVARLHPERMRMRVVDIVQATPSAKTFHLERIDGPLPPFRPGQYLNVFVDVDGVLTSRPYSLASAPCGEGQGTLELTVRDKPGGFVAPYLLNEVRPGDKLETTGPAGAFYHEPLIDGDDLVFLAGGSGITPFMSLIRDALQHKRPLKIHLLYGSRVPEDVIYAQELAALAGGEPLDGQRSPLVRRRSATKPNDALADARTHSDARSVTEPFRYDLVISEPPPGYDGLTGFLSADLIRRRVGDPNGKTFYICGPNVMYDYCRAALEELGVPPHKIKRELYGPPDDVTREPGWPPDLPASARFEIEVEGKATIRAAAVEPLLNSLERHGLAIPAVCRAGECSACRTRLVSGRVYQPAHTGLRESDRRHGYIHACVSYPLEDLIIRI
jgi:ferredoxin-NADP reductase